MYIYIDIYMCVCVYKLLIVQVSSLSEMDTTTRVQILD